MKINYIVGDATEPIKTPSVIVHCVNNVNKWGSGFVLAISSKWKQPEEKYKELFVSNPSMRGNKDLLGEIQLVKVEDNIWVCNLFGQHSIKSQYNLVPARPWAIERGLASLQEHINKNHWTNHTIHMPRIASGRGGLAFSDVEPLIINTMLSDVYVYDYDGRDPSVI